MLVGAVICFYSIFLVSGPLPAYRKCLLGLPAPQLQLISDGKHLRADAVARRIQQKQPSQFSCVQAMQYRVLYRYNLLAGKQQAGFLKLKRVVM
jgi:hypothetical protein